LLFTRRIEEGRIRECHGDLRAKHIFLEGDAVQVIDCIEFNRDFRYQDTASDVAFLTMDLDRLGFPAPSNVFLNAYLEGSGDYGLVSVLDFYQVYRAYVRGKVTSFLLDDPGLAETERADAVARARRFFDLAVGYVDRQGAGRRGGLLVTCGITGTGKSTVARALAKARGSVIVRSDAIRKSLVGLAPTTRAREGFGEGIYGHDATALTYETLLRTAETVLRAGKEVIVDATFLRREFRDAARSLADALGVPFHILWCRADDAEIARRLVQREQDIENISDGRSEIAAAQRLALDPFDEPERPSLIPIDTQQGEAGWIRAVEHSAS
jgi:predicted kinase